jgi:CubicO group peptidase (beta-lactamase class C family)
MTGGNMTLSAKWQYNLKNLSVVRLQLVVLALILFIPIISASAADYWPKDKWRTATPESQGMSSEILSEMMDLLWQTNHEIDSILIVRNGYVVLDTYNFPEQPNLKHHLYSCTKSVSSTLIGIAIDKGYIKSVDQPLLDFFPEKIPENPDSRKKQITLKHVLMMATGLKCQDSYLYGWKGLIEMNTSEDCVQHVINLPMVEVSGTHFEYCNGASAILTAIIQKTTGKTGLEFAKEHLFNPLGINDIHWEANWGITMGYAGLHMRPRDMARFGYLFLNNGKWNNRQIVSPKWVAESTQKHISATITPGYGYQWWILSPDIYIAAGYAGQGIFVLKDKKMVVVFTGRLKALKDFLPKGILQGYIILAIKSNSPLPENPKALKRLKSLDHFWQTANYVVRDKRLKKMKSVQFKPKQTLYVNKQFGFSVEYDAELIVNEQSLEPPLVFRKARLTGSPYISAVVDDIPHGLKLNESEKYVVRHLEKTPYFSDIKVIRKEIIRLSDGTTANYYEINAKYQIYEIVTAGVIGYKNKKLIGVSATSALRTPLEYLRGMVTSLKLRMAKP